MSAIKRIDVHIITGDKPRAGTDGEVYIGICGREFYLNAAGDDFERGSNRTYILGEGGDLYYKQYNDPRSPQLDTVDLDKFPKYIRFEPTGSYPDWNLEGVTVTVNPGPSEVAYSALAKGANLWLGQKYGKVCYLK